MSNYYDAPERNNQRTAAQLGMLNELLERVTRIESRLVQLFYFLEADPNGRYNAAKEDWK